MRVVDRVQKGHEFDEPVTYRGCLGVDDDHDLIPDVIDLDFKVLVGESGDGQISVADTKLFGGNASGKFGLDLQGERLSPGSGKDFHLGGHELLCCDPTGRVLNQRR